MFDAKALLEQLAQGAAASSAPQAPGQSAGGLGDLLGQVLGGGQAGGAGGLGGLEGMLRNIAGQSGGGTPGGPGGGGLADILAKLQEAAGGAAQGGTQGPGAGGGLSDILGKLQNQVGGAGQGGAGGITDLLGQILGQATEGVKEGAGRIGEATGARDILTQASGGKSPEEMIAQLKDLIANNQLTAGAVLGGLGGLMLGTRTGRGLMTSAAKLGAVAMISGLAYKAYQNYQTGKPLITGASPLLERAPAGSGFEPQAVSNERAALMLRAMIAAAAADGRIDENEQARIMGSLGHGGLDAEAKAFLQREIQNPATPDDLARSVGSAEEALQVYTAARIAIDPDHPAEGRFLAALATRLEIEPKLAAHIDATAKGAMAG